MDKLTHEKYLQAVRYLGIRARTEFEMRRWLSKKNIAEGETQEILDALKQEGALNDAHYASEYIEMGIKYRPQGRLLLFRRLRALGVDQELIEHTLNERYPREAEQELCLTLAGRKLKEVVRLERRDQVARVGRYLASRGFREEDIWNALESLGLSS